MLEALAAPVIGYFSSQANQRQQAQNNMHMWQVQAQYNTPANQVKRLKEANLSPHLAYGHGNIVNTQQQAPAPVDYVAANLAGQQGIENIVKAITAKKIAEEVEKTEAETENITSDTVLKDMLATFNAATMNLDIQAKEFANKLLQENILKTRNETATEVERRLLVIEQASNLAQLTDHTAKLFPTTFQQAVLNTLNTAAQTAYTKAQTSKVPYEKTQLLAESKALWEQARNLKEDTQLKQFSVKLSKSGLTASDPAFLRLIQQYGGEPLTGSIIYGVAGAAGNVVGGVLGRGFGRLLAKSMAKKTVKKVAKN